MDNIKVVIEHKKIHLLCLLKDYKNSLDGKKIAIIKKMYNYNIIKENNSNITELNLHENDYTINGKNVYVVVNTIDVDNLDSMYSVINTPYGISNEGDTCFFNGTLQVLINDKMYMTELCNRILFKYTNIDRVVNGAHIDINYFNDFNDITVYLLLNLLIILYNFNNRKLSSGRKLNDNLEFAKVPFLKDIVKFLQLWITYKSDPEQKFENHVMEDGETIYIRVRNEGTIQQDANETFMFLETYIGYEQDNVLNSRYNNSVYDEFRLRYHIYEDLKFNIPEITISSDDEYNRKFIFFNNPHKHKIKNFHTNYATWATYIENIKNNILKIPELGIDKAPNNITDDITYELVTLSNNGAIFLPILEMVKVVSNQQDKHISEVTYSYIKNNKYELIPNSNDAKYYYHTSGSAREFVVFEDPTNTDIKLLQKKDYKKLTPFKVPHNYLKTLDEINLAAGIAALRNIPRGKPGKKPHALLNELIKENIKVEKYELKEHVIQSSDNRDDNIYNTFDGQNTIEYVLSFPFLLYIYIKRLYHTGQYINIFEPVHNVNREGIDIKHEDSILKTKADTNLIYFSVKDLIDLYQPEDILNKTYKNYSFEHMKSHLKTLYKDKEYVLTGMVEGGGLVVGHYISYIYNNNTDSWFKCDDSQITYIEDIKDTLYNENKINSLSFYLRDKDI